MAFPWIFSENFELGTKGAFDTEADTDGILDFPHYSELARYGLAPYSGAYCMRLKYDGVGTNDATLEEGSIDIAATVQRFLSFNVCFGFDFGNSAASADIVHLFEAQATSTIETAMGFTVAAASVTGVLDTSADITLGIGETTITSSTSWNLQRGKWYHVDLDMQNDPGANDGTIDMFVTREGDAVPAVVSVTQVGSLDQGAVTRGFVGSQLHTTDIRGTVLIDNVIFDDLRIYATTTRYPETQHITEAQQHVFVGKGMVGNITLLSGVTADCVLTAYDTDTSDSNDASNIVATLRNTGTTGGEIVDPAGMPVEVTRGLYITLAGTQIAEGPRGLVQIDHARAYTNANVISAGMNRNLRGR